MNKILENIKNNINQGSAIKIILIYTLLGGIWALFSIYVIPNWVPDIERHAEYHFYNSLLFLVTSIGLLFLFFREKFITFSSIEKELSENKEKLQFIISNAPVGLWILDSAGVFTFSEGKGLQPLRPVPSIVVGKSVFDVYKNNPKILDNCRRALAGESFSAIVEVNGVFFESWYSPVLDQHGKVTHIVGVSTNITERKKAEEKIKYQAFYDPLTGLPNRHLFFDRLQQALIKSQRENQSLAILVVDINRFREINNTLGHPYGDLVLKQIGNRLQNIIRKSDTVSRLEGDQFAVLLLNSGQKGADLVAGHILKVMEEPLILEGLHMEIETNIGIALFPEHGEKFDDLLRCAEVAKELAKDDGKGYASYRSQKDPYTTQRLTLLGELRKAIDQDEIFMVYQPKINLKTGRVAGVESLVRWEHPQKGLVPPDQFIPAAENSGLIKPLSVWIINQVLRQCRDWIKEGTELPVAINLSRRNLHDPNLYNQIVEGLESHNIPPELVELEITESIIMANVTAAIKILSRIKELGVQLSIDDFGTGYSSLGSLKKLPVDCLKIDQSFVSNMANDKDDEMIVRSTIDLAHNLGLEVVAEGVEREDTRNRLAEMGCDYIQGYHISRPLPADQFIQWMDKSPWGTINKNKNFWKKAG